MNNVQTPARNEGEIKTMWYSVETPSVFREFCLLFDPQTRNVAQRRQYLLLRRLACSHQTVITISSYRRG